MRKTGTLGIANDHVFKRRASDSGAERERCRDADSDGELTPRAQWDAVGNEVEFDRGNIGDRPRQRQDAGDCEQAIVARFGVVAAWVDARWRLQHFRQLRPARSRRRRDGLERVRVRQAAEQPTEHEGTEPLGPRIQSRVRWCLSRVRPPRCHAQAVVGLDVCRGDRGDHRQAIALVRQHVRRQHAESTFADRATGQRDRQGQPCRYNFTAAIIDQQHRRPRDSRTQNRQVGPEQPRGQRVVGGSPFNNSDS